MNLLMKVKPLVVNPELAARIGLNEAIVLQQICYWLEETESGVERDGVRWVYNTHEQWCEQFPFWSLDTVKRTLNSLKKQELIRSEQLNKSRHDRTNFYSINFENSILSDECNLPSSSSAKTNNREMQNALVEDGKMPPSIRCNLPSSMGGKMPSSLTENTTENTTEITGKDSCQVSEKPDDEGDFLSAYPEAVIYSAKKRQWGTTEDLRCAKWIWTRITDLYEKAAETDGEISKPKEPNWVDWANEIRLMCARDGRNHRQICELFGRAQRDAFWCRNVLSPSKLREKWDELSLKLSPSAGQRDVNQTASVDYAHPDGWRGA